MLSEKSKVTWTDKKNTENYFEDDEELDNSTQPEFIYGGPFLKSTKPEFLDIVTPVNIQLQGTFKRSFAYHSLKERFPVILTKIIDYLSREEKNIISKYKVAHEDVRNLIKYVVKLKNDIATNKIYTPLSVDTPEARKWNEWIQNSDSPYYFTNNWVFSECYVYRRLREGCELSNGLVNFDPFEEQKIQSFKENLEPMRVVAGKVVEMLQKSEKEKLKADFITLLKLCLWSNKCDLSLSMGEQVSLVNKENVGTSPSQTVIDPFQMILDFKDKVLVDDSAKICDQVIAKAEKLATIIEAHPPARATCSCGRVAAEALQPTTNKAPKKEKARKGKGPPKGESPPKGKGPPEGEGTPKEDEGPPQPPCPAKIVTPATVMFDIVCDNAGYELFTDLCLADFLISQNIVKKVRFHVKSIPWFVSDVTPEDFKYVINQCATSIFKSEHPPPQPKTTEGAEGEEDPSQTDKNTLSPEGLRTLGERWKSHLDNGTFELLCDSFWTSPHVYKDMKKYDPHLYRNLQFAVAILFKGDLNYRKLLGERNCNPTISFESALQGFMPAPVVALRTVKADLICGLKKGRAEQLSNTDDRWMEKGDYGVIQFCAKSEALKVSDRPCPLYGTICTGVGCGNNLEGLGEGPGEEPGKGPVEEPIEEPGEEQPGKKGLFGMFKK